MVLGNRVCVRYGGRIRPDHKHPIADRNPVTGSFHAHDGPNPRRRDANKSITNVDQRLDDRCGCRHTNIRSMLRATAGLG